MKVQDLIEQLKKAPEDMDVVFNYISKSGEDDFTLDIDECGVYPIQIEDENGVRQEDVFYFCLNTVEPDLKELGINYDISMN